MDALQGQKREKSIVVPRQIAMYLMREETEVSLLRIGAELGGRDHSTVLEGVRRASMRFPAHKKRLVEVSKRLNIKINIEGL